VDGLVRGRAAHQAGGTTVPIRHYVEPATRARAIRLRSLVVDAPCGSRARFRASGSDRRIRQNREVLDRSGSRF